MSMNYKEIDLALSELKLQGARIQKALQPSYDTLVLEIFDNAEGKRNLLISVSAGACRIHALARLPPKNERPLRFMECLKSRVRGGRIESAEQLSSDRIVKIRIQAPLGDADKPSAYTLYARLWSGAGNIVLVDEDNMVVDALYRKPKKNESSGMLCLIETSLSAAKPSEQNARRLAEIAVRDLPGEGSYSQRLEAYYGDKTGSLSREHLLAQAAERYKKKLRAIETRNAELEHRLKEYNGAARYREIGDILMAGLPGFPSPSAKPGLKPGSSAFVETLDFFSGKTLSVQIDPALSLVENAQAYYEKYKKAFSGLEDLKKELAKTKAAREDLEAWRLRLESEPDPFAIARALEKAGTVREKARRAYPCLWIEYKGWFLLVGRSAKENDELLRRWVRGSDLWLHARDYAGSYVFVKAQKAKSFPLDIMLAAAALALYYSKARKNGEGNVYYTQAKHLRRVKDGPRGLVVPGMEKNLFVRLDETRIRELLAGAEGAAS